MGNLRTYQVHALFSCIKEGNPRLFGKKKKSLGVVTKMFVLNVNTTFQSFVVVGGDIKLAS